METIPTRAGRERIDYIDILKGLGMLLVIAGHTFKVTAVRGAIYSFHMPLFFIASGFTFQCSASGREFWDRAKRSLVRLVLAAYGAFLLYEGIGWLAKGQSLGLRQALRAMLYSSGVEFAPPNDQTAREIASIGLMWFPIVLFECRSIWDGLHRFAGERVATVAACALAVLGVGIGRLVWLPFALDVALASVVFLCAGRWLMQTRVHERMHAKHHAALIVFAWGGALLEYWLTRDCLVLARRRYPLFPLCYLIAMACTVEALALSRSISRFRRLATPLKFLGRNSFLLLFVHYFDAFWSPLWYIGRGRGFLDGSVNTIARAAVDIAIFCAVLAGRRLLERRRRGSKGVR